MIVLSGIPQWYTSGRVNTGIETSCQNRGYTFLTGPEGVSGFLLAVDQFVRIANTLLIFVNFIRKSLDHAQQI